MEGTSQGKNKKQTKIPSWSKNRITSGAYHVWTDLGNAKGMDSREKGINLRHTIAGVSVPTAVLWGKRYDWNARTYVGNFFLRIGS